VNSEDTNGEITVRTFSVAMADNGQVRNSLINGQNLPQYRNIPYLESNIGYSGCEAIASYNAATMLGMNESFEDVKEFYVKRFLSTPLSGWDMYGRWGATPGDIASFLRSKNLSFVGSGNLKCLNEMVNTSGVLIISYFNKPVFDGYHTIAIRYDRGHYIGLNHNCNSYAPSSAKSKIGDFMEGGWRFFYGFFIPQL